MAENPTIFTWITICCWVLFCSYWLLLRNRTKENVQVRTIKQRLMGVLGHVLIFTLMYLPLFVSGGFAGRILPASYPLQFTGAILCAAGVGIAIWSRLLLGNNWSGGVTAKKDHELVIKGPYRFVRHPIYTGYIMAMAGTCLVTGGLAAIVFTALYAMGLCVKINQEEVMLSNLFPGTYSTYQQHTRKLIPFIW